MCVVCMLLCVFVFIVYVVCDWFSVYVVCNEVPMVCLSGVCVVDVLQMCFVCFVCILCDGCVCMLCSFA